MATEPVEPENDPEVVPAESLHAQPSALSGTRLAIALLVTTLIGWAVVAYLPPWFHIPEELANVGADSPAAQQQELQQEEGIAAGKNATVRYTLLGLCYGAVPLFLLAGAHVRRPIVVVVASLLIGLIAGWLASMAGAAMRNYLDTGGTIPLVGEAGQSMAGDSLVLIIVGVLLGLPIAMGIALMGLPQSGQKAVGAPLGGLLAGLLFPIVASFAMPGVNTQDFPLQGAGALGLWLAMFALFVTLFMVMTGGSRRGDAPAESAPATV